MLVRSGDLLFVVVAATVAFVLAAHHHGGSREPQPDLGALLGCYKREYVLKAARTDDFGRQCWDYIRVPSCWGRCDSFEVPDWRFPFKISYHPVCIHDRKRLRRVLLRKCDPGANPALRVYEYYEAVECSCRICNSSNTSCDWRHHMSTFPASHSLTPSHHHHHHASPPMDDGDSGLL